MPAKYYQSTFKNKVLRPFFFTFRDDQSTLMSLKKIWPKVDPFFKKFGL